MFSALRSIVTRFAVPITAGLGGIAIGQATAGPTTSITESGPGGVDFTTGGIPWWGWLLIAAGVIIGIYYYLTHKTRE
jgi:hypothetical protein